MKRIFLIGVLLLMSLDILAYAGVEQYPDYVSNPGVFRNYYQGTEFEAMTDGNLSTSAVNTMGDITLTFPTAVVTHFKLKAVGVPTKQPTLKFLLNGTSKYTTADGTAPAPTYNWLNSGIGYEVNKIIVMNCQEIFEFDIWYEIPYPILTFGMPKDSASNVSIYENFTATFDKVVYSYSSSIVKQNGEEVAYNKSGLYTSTIKLNPAALLDFDTKYIVTIKDVAGYNGVVNPNTYVFTFTTIPDTAPVRLINVIPPNGSSNVSTDISQCILEFDKPNIDINTVTDSNIFVSDNANNVISSTMTHHVDGSRFVVQVDIPKLQYETDYYINVKDVQDTKGNPLETTYKMRFKTSSDPDEFKILSYRPVNNSVVSLNRKIEIVFSQPIVMEDLNYTLTDKDGNSVSSVPQIMGSALYITATLEYGNTYDFDLNLVKSTSGKTLENAISIHFRTMNNTNNNFLNELLGSMMDLFEAVKHYGLIIVIGAIAIGVIFVVAIWLWKKLKKWLIKS